MHPCSAAYYQTAEQGRNPDQLDGKPGEEAHEGGVPDNNVVVEGVTRRPHRSPYCTDGGIRGEKTTGGAREAGVVAPCSSADGAGTVACEGRQPRSHDSAAHDAGTWTEAGGLSCAAERRYVGGSCDDSSVWVASGCMVMVTLRVGEMCRRVGRRRACKNFGLLKEPQSYDVRCGKFWRALAGFPLTENDPAAASLPEFPSADYLPVKLNFLA